MYNQALVVCMLTVVPMVLNASEEQKPRFAGSARTLLREAAREATADNWSNEYGGSDFEVEESEGADQPSEFNYFGAGSEGDIRVDSVPTTTVVPNGVSARCPTGFRCPVTK